MFGTQEWKENPIVRMRLRPKDEDDGSFWMPWDEFSRIYTRVQVCDRSTGRDLKLDVKEDFGACGVVVGCCAGQLSFHHLNCHGCLPSDAFADYCAQS
jgi:hypothetical protein